MCSGHGIILQTLLSAAIMIQAWSLEHRNPAEMGLSLGAAGEATGTSQKAEAPGWESFSFNIPSFLAGLTACGPDFPDCQVKLSASVVPVPVWSFKKYADIHNA